MKNTNRLMLVFVMMGLTYVAPAAETSKHIIRAFHVGNSLTYGVMTSGLADFLSSRGSNYECGWHVLWGKGLPEIWETANAPSDKTEKYGAFPAALANNEWDVLTLQSWGREFEGENGDVPAAKKFIGLALKKSPNVQVFIYEVWPFRDMTGKMDFATMWTRDYQTSLGKVQTGTYCKELVKRLNKEMPDLKKPVRLIPAGSVLAELDKQIKAGKVPGIKQIDELYKDIVHLNNVGNYLVRCTFYAVIMKANPTGLPGLTKEMSEEQAKLFQETAWKVVSQLAQGPGAGP